MRKIGQYTKVNALEGIRGIGWKMLSALGFAPDEIEKIVLEAQDEIQSEKCRLWSPT
jgi:hypothetical protein